MLHEKIETLFRTLSCTNTDIARAAGWSRSYISHIRRGDRDFTPSSKAIRRFAESVCRFADEQGNLSSLRLLIGAGDSGSETLVPSLIAWLFDTDHIPAPSDPSPEKKIPHAKSAKQQEFGDRLDAVMNLLELSNTRLARSINVDDSLVSRWRSGLRSPKNNLALANLLSRTLLERSRSMKCEEKLAELSGLALSLLEEPSGVELWEAWLLGTERTSIVPAMDNFLESISRLSVLPSLPADLPEPVVPSFHKEQYWNIEGLRQAVVRFLANAVKEGGELWLYSDENMTWATGDPDFYKNWQLLMAACIRAGIKIKIIHNVDRGMDEMLAAINSWIPLYMSGQIEPFVCHKSRDMRFFHTIFLRPGAECILGMGINDASDNWYDYVTDSKRLAAIRRQYETLLSSCDPLVKVYVGQTRHSLFSEFSMTEKREICSVLSAPSLSTLPIEVLHGMLTRSSLDAEVKKEIFAIAKKRHFELKKCLSEKICEIVTLPPETALFEGQVRVNLSMELIGAELFYTAEEYAAHIRAVLDLLISEKNYHFFVLPQLPFEDIQIVLTHTGVTVIRSKPPLAAFCITDPLMIHAFWEYFESLKERHCTDQGTVCRMLKRYL